MLFHHVGQVGFVVWAVLPLGRPADHSTSRLEGQAVAAAYGLLDFGSGMATRAVAGTWPRLYTMKVRRNVITSVPS